MIDILTLDEYELELYNSSDPADQLALKIRLKIKGMNLNPDETEIIDSHWNFNSTPDFIIEEVPYVWKKIKIDNET